ncbi:MAG: hypothetical protein ACOH2H_22540 [Cypionkella sp.]
MAGAGPQEWEDHLQNSTFIGPDVHKATISVAVAQGERGGEVCHWGQFRTARIMSTSWWRSWPQIAGLMSGWSLALVVEAVQAMRWVAFIVAVTVVAEV